jgi:hypothetical protein
MGVTTTMTAGSWPVDEPSAERVSVQSRRRARPATQSQVAVFECLIISADARRRSTLIQAAETGGWTCYGCATFDDARARWQQRATKLVILDLAPLSAVEAAEWRQAYRSLGATADQLSVVCGGSGDQAGERWARESGAWVYLPGLGEDSGLNLVCSAAMSVAQRLAASP